LRGRFYIVLFSCLTAVSLALLWVLSMPEYWDNVRYRLLRDAVIQAEMTWEKTRAYKAFFAHVGLAHLHELENDPDTSIALQSLWEP